MKVTVITPLKFDPKKPAAKPGTIVDVDDDEAAELIASGAVEAVKAAPKDEKK
jgi:hypothetical protein